MRKLKVFSAMFLASLMTMSVATSVSALSWKDGALSKYYFTYTGGDEGVVSVTASDTNNTYNGAVEEGQTIVTKTGTIAWRDSYTNVTTFTVDVKPGYYIAGFNGNVGDGKLSQVDEDTYTFQFTDKGAEAWCYGDDVDFSINTEKYDYIFVDKNGRQVGAGKVGEKVIIENGQAPAGYQFDGWKLSDEIVIKNDENVKLTEDMVKLANESYEITVEPVTSKIVYKFVIKEGIKVGEGKIGEEIIFDQVVDKYGHDFKGWKLEDGTLIDNGSTLTYDIIDLLKLNNNVLVVEPEFVKKNVKFTVNKYINNNDKNGYGGELVEEVSFEAPFGTIIDENYIRNVLGITSEYKVIGEKSIVLNNLDENYVIDLAKEDKAYSGALREDYSFTYASKDDGIESVSYVVNGKEEKGSILDLNETVKITVNGWDLTNPKTIKFTVKVADGKELVLNCPGTDNEVTNNGDGTYSFQITVNGFNNNKQAHFDFSLNTVDKQ